MIIVLMGVTGSGKTRVGGALVRELGWSFYDADDFHPPENIARMSSGTALTDVEREPWLAQLQALVRKLAAERAHAVLACSSLRSEFRERLRGGVEGLRYVYLRATPELIAERLSARSGHFMPATLIGSQFAALEEPECEVELDAGRSVEELVGEIRTRLGI